ncbi:helix-turn-helix domain-containing protein [Burkholderia sp. AU19243]|uniref:citrate/2-methylcitrate synthase n=1 Tax=Burkholderia TaxID=32008 RepID=UPI0008412F9D|nr:MULTISPECIES: citrate/2-methylcitrate synthase [Burkholderia]MBR8145774.1 helix-turn-helix domain-containing protein [Burkholderia vietnamiensis]AOK05170.1 citrate synthase [Burkholderia latens]MBR8367032.1 helix-turn-helix domain-containing protein [Burkholderia sp. AU19243]MBY4697974.1 helix-turn-helix domain-containing protein [Burkholderia latens]MCA8310645.1 helix-turn-helix domain-containing protein [Burkholderia sp. AU28942]
MTSVSAPEAAGILGVSVSTLYAYVSRGLLRSLPDGASKRRRYDADEVRLLARRRADAKRAGGVAERSLDWGVPVLESRITQIADGRLRYRGVDAVVLANSATLEETAARLWDCPPARLAATSLAAGGFDAAQWGDWTRRWMHLPPLERALVLLPAAAASLPRLWALERDAQFDTAALLLRITAAALAGAAPGNAPVHRQLAAAWRIRRRDEADLLRRALVLCADHELNPSTFAVRCIASTGTHLFGAVAGGLAALSGPRHGGETFRAGALLDEAARAADLDRYLALRVAHDERADGARTVLSGFAHPLYPDGDPRARALLDALHAAVPDRAPLRMARALAVRVETATGLRPTIDFALAVLERTLALPDGAAFTLFAAGRTAGWIAHALEQYADGKLIRPRARYVGSVAAA